MRTDMITSICTNAKSLDIRIINPSPLNNQKILSLTNALLHQFFVIPTPSTQQFRYLFMAALYFYDYSSILITSPPPFLLFFSPRGNNFWKLLFASVMVSAIFSINCRLYNLQYVQIDKQTKKIETLAFTSRLSSNVKIFEV